MATISVTGVGNIPSVAFSLPPWVTNSGQNFYIFAGVEVLAIYIYSENQWYVKDQKCNRCGDCCRDIGITHPNHIYPTINNACSHMRQLGGEWDCIIGNMRPMSCAIKPEPHDIGNYTNCSITYLQDTPVGNDLDITIPDWAQYRPFYFIVGRELFGSYEPVSGGWTYKKKRCDNCGDCCRGMSASTHLFPVIADACSYLNSENECSLGNNCPIACTLDPPLGAYDNCNITKDGMI